MCLVGRLLFGSYIDEPLMMVSGANKYYYHANNLYSVAALTDAAGAVVERYTYDPYGKVKILAADGITVLAASSVGNPWTFTGRRLDGETGLMYYRARMYSSELGRFISRDPLAQIENQLLIGSSNWLIWVLEKSPAIWSSKYYFTVRGVRRGNLKIRNVSAYTYVSSNPTTLMDVYGLYEEEWEGTWAEEEKKKIRESFDRISKRIDDLTKQIDNELNSLPKDDCCKALRAELEKLKGTLKKIKDGIASKEENLEFYKVDMGKEKIETEASSWGPSGIYDPELKFNTIAQNPWNTMSNADLDRLLLHELSHMYGTEDDDSKGIFQNAHNLDDLMNGDLSGNTNYEFDKKKCLKVHEKHEKKPEKGGKAK